MLVFLMVLRAVASVVIGCLACVLDVSTGFKTKQGIPDDAHSWLRDYHNSILFQSGATVSFVQILVEVPTYDANWQAHASLSGLLVSDHTETLKYLKSKVDYFRTYNMFECSRALVNNLTDLTR